MTWIRNRYVWVVVILAVTAGAVVAVRSVGSKAEPADLQTQVMNRLRTTLEQSDPGQHNHAGHAAQPAEAAEVICGVRVYGFEPAEATTITDVRTVYGFHLCGVAEKEMPWDVATKLAGPVIVDMASTPPGIQVVEATENVMYIDRLREMFPPRYADLAQKEALSEREMSDLRRRFDAAAKA